MVTSLDAAVLLTPQQLVEALDALGVHFLRGGSGAQVHVEPAALLAGLADGKPDHRMRYQLMR